MPHLPDATLIADKKMTLGQYKQTDKYKNNLAKCVDQVRRGQHLRFIGGIYRTTKVCTIAVLNSPNDISCVPKVLQKEVIENVLSQRHNHFDANLTAFECWYGPELTKIINDVKGKIGIPIVKFQLESSEKIDRD